MNPLFETLITLEQERKNLQAALSLLSWDQETYMPEAGSAARASQIELLASLAHQKITSTEMHSALSALIDLESGDILIENCTDEEKAALYEWRRNYLLETKLPNAFVKKQAKLCSEAFTAWMSAKKENDFALFAPYLEKLVSSAKKRADYFGYDEHPYDALLSEYETGMTTSMLKKIFSELKPFLIQILTDAKDETPYPFLHEVYEESKQLFFAKQLLTAMGVDFTRARLDLSHHPFCSTIHPTDVRMTTHTDLSNFFNGLSAVLHEGGHALYELGLPAEKYGTPLAEACSLGIHESQSRFWECFIGLSRPFVNYLHNELRISFPDKLGGVSQETLYTALTQIKPSFIRIKSDEVSYCLHIILRFEIELGLIEGSLSVEDIPEVWNKKMSEYLGICPETNSEGCLQDVHWSHGIFGYFPTYALGNIYAGSLFAAFIKAHPDWEIRVERGELSFIRDWLGEKIHTFGKRYTPLELIEKATGHPFSTAPYKDYLRSKTS